MKAEVERLKLLLMDLASRPHFAEPSDDTSQILSKLSAVINAAQFEVSCFRWQPLFLVAGTTGFHLTVKQYLIEGRHFQITEDNYSVPVRIVGEPYLEASYSHDNSEFHFFYLRVPLAEPVRNEGFTTHPATSAQRIPESMMTSDVLIPFPTSDNYQLLLQAWRLFRALAVKNLISGNSSQCESEDPKTPGNIREHRRRF